MWIRRNLRVLYKANTSTCLMTFCWKNISGKICKDNVWGKMCMKKCAGKIELERVNRNTYAGILFQGYQENTKMVQGGDAIEPR